jgi:cytolysin (calcineurin-like family phosphatase)
MTIGNLYHQNNIVIGTSLIEAIKEEENTAIYPRILATLDFINFLKQSTYWRMLERYFKIDFDGLYFVDYLKLFYGSAGSYYLFSMLRDKIVNTMAANSKNLHIFAKWHWMAQYYNTSIQLWNSHHTRQMPALEPIAL